jgi:hypothetical protein
VTTRTARRGSVSAGKGGWWYYFKIDIKVGFALALDSIETIAKWTLLVYKFNPSDV